MIVRYPFREAFEEDDVPKHMTVIWSITEDLRHFELANGYVVSVLHSVFGWEAWASIDEYFVTNRPVVFDNEYEAIAYRDGIASRTTTRGDS